MARHRRPPFWRATVTKLLLAMAVTLAVAGLALLVDIDPRQGVVQAPTETPTL